MVGVFDLTKPSDLLAKLQRELGRLQAEPDNVDHAFNFFVTAEHILDWLHPGLDGAARRARDALRGSDPLLELAAHLANGSKHFDRLSRKHQSITGTARRGGWFSPNWVARNWFGRGYFAQPTLTVELQGKAEQTYGSSVTAVFLAEELVKYWAAPGKVSP